MMMKRKCVVDIAQTPMDFWSFGGRRFAITVKQILGRCRQWYRRLMFQSLSIAGDIAGLAQK